MLPGNSAVTHGIAGQMWCSGRWHVACGPTSKRYCSGRPAAARRVLLAEVLGDPGSG
jgi:hypothetical protein